MIAIQQYSLLVPCYNATNFISGFLENLEKLTLPFDEVIFYDDASTDDTANILLALGYHVIQGTINSGPAYARNKLIEAAHFDWIHFHDIDDFMDPAFLDKTSKLAKKELVDVIICNVDWYDACTKELVVSWTYRQDEIDTHALNYTISHPIGGINGLYRKETLIEAGGFNADIRIWEDADMHVRLAGINARFCIIEEVLSYAYRYAETASSDQTVAWLIRAGQLWTYYHSYVHSNTRLEIGRQSQLAAAALLLSGSGRAARKALQLSELCGVKVPVSQKLHWRIYKGILPLFLRIELRLVHLKFAFRKKITF